MLDTERVIKQIIPATDVWALYYDEQTGGVFYDEVRFACLCASDYIEYASVDATGVFGFPLEASNFACFLFESPELYTQSDLLDIVARYKKFNNRGVKSSQTKETSC